MRQILTIFLMICTFCLTPVFGQEANVTKVNFQDFPLDSVCFQYIFHLRHTDERGASIAPDPMIIDSEEKYQILLKLKPDDSNMICTHKYDSSDGGMWFRQCEGPKEYVEGLMQKCLNVDLPKIDFTQKTILSQYAESLDRSATFKKEVVKDDINKQIVYSVEVIEHYPPNVLCASGCAYEESLNLIVIPKVPEGYKVIFKYKNDMPYTKNKNVGLSI